MLLGKSYIDHRVYPHPGDQSEIIPLSQKHGCERAFIRLKVRIAIV